MKSGLIGCWEGEKKNTVNRDQITDSYDGFVEQRVEEIGREGWFYAREYIAFAERTLGNHFKNYSRMHNYSVLYNEDRTEFIFFGNSDEKIYTCIEERESRWFNEDEIETIHRALREWMEQYCEVEVVAKMFETNAEDLAELVREVEDAIHRAIYGFDR